MVPEPCQPRSGFSSPWWDFSLLPSAKADHQFAGLIYRSRLGRDIQIPITPPPSGRTIAGCTEAQKGCYRAQHRPQMSLWRVRCPCRFSPLALGKNTPSPLRKSARTLYLPRTTGFRSALPGRQRMNRHEQLLAQQLLYLGNYVLGFEGLYDVTVRSQ